MIFKSLKSYLYLIISAIALQLFLMTGDLYLHTVSQSNQMHQNTFIKNASLFLENLSIEKELEQTPSVNDLLKTRYRNLIKASDSNNLEFNTALLHRRISLNSEFSELWIKKRKLHSRLNIILPSLSTSVSYIHEHHLAYLKNLFRRGVYEQDYDAAEGASRTEVKPASELDIITVAIDIQNSMLEIMEIFSRVQRGLSPKNIHSDFSRAITEFYDATNTFEDYSLDAQDGLLVEELLINGNTFETSFKQFLQLEAAIHNIEISLDLNRREFLEHISRLKKSNEIRHADFLSKVEKIKTASLILNLVLIVILFFIANRVIRALVKTVKETQKIQNDLSYRIPTPKADFKEFRFIYKTLNLMGQTVGKKLNELSEAQALLEHEVSSRTLELSKANQQLQDEIDERIKNEQQRQELEERLSRAEKMEALGTLAGGVAHDLNNILSGIVSYPEILLLDLPEDSPLRGPLMTIKASGVKAAVIVQDLLTMARRSVAKHESLDLNKVIQDYLKCPELKNILNHHPQVTVEDNLDAGISVIMGSKVHLQKMLTNLIANSAESISAKGTITISTSNHYIDTALKEYDHVKEGEYIKLSITDDGIGISQANLEKIFEPFFTTKTMGRSGSGLGMAVVWGTVKDHGGYIDVSSRKMSGTTFDLYFPLYRGRHEIDSQDIYIEDLMAKGETVLVVDDMQDQREIASLMLRRLGYNVETVASGETAIDYLRYHDADILVLDMIMNPGIDGLETYREVIKTKPHQKAIIVSGFSESNKVLEAQALGTGGYVKKPYTLRDIASALRAELDKK